MICKILSARAEVFQSKDKQNTYRVVKGAVENPRNGNVYSYNCFTEVDSKVVPKVGQVVSCHDLKGSFEFNTIFIKAENGYFVKP